MDISTAPSAVSTPPAASASPRPATRAYTLWVDRPGFAFASVNFGGRDVSLPGQYVRQRDDGACWANPETNTKICAW